MSWSCNVRGSIEKVKPYVDSELDRYTKMYSEYGTPDGDAEAQDCRDAKRAIFARIDAMKFDADTLAFAGYELDVQAYGSRSNDGTMSMHVSVSKAIVPITGG